jgi:hypothetical protein
LESSDAFPLLVTTPSATGKPICECYAGADCFALRASRTSCVDDIQGKTIIVIVINTTA